MAAKLNSAMNRDEQKDLPWPQEIPSCPGMEDVKELSKWIRRDNPELKIKSMLTKKAADSIDLAKKGYFPDLSLGLEYIETKHASMSRVRDSGKDPWIASISLTLP